MLGGSGINFWGDQTNISMVSGNEISGNLWGVTVQNQARPNMGQVDPDTLNPGKNLFFDNGNNGVIYALYNNTPNPLFAENNYWGTIDPDTVEAYIFHQPDNPALGLVDYLPIKDYFTTLPEQNELKSPCLNVFPNPTESVVFFEIPGGTDALINPELLLMDLFGRVVYSKKLTFPSQGVDISFIQAGVYFVHISAGHKRFTSTLIRH